MTVAVATPREPRDAWPGGPLDLRSPRVPIAVVAIAALAGVAAAASPAFAVAGTLAVLVAILVAGRPVVGAYVMAVASPLTIGLGRGTYLPGLRPHEVLLFAIALALCGRWLWDARGRPMTLRPTAVHVSLVALAVTSSIVPVLWLLIRGLPLSGDDLAYAMVMWKYVVLFCVIRFAVRTPGQVAAVLGLWLGGAAVVAVVALLQVRGLLGVQGFLAAHFAPLGDEAATQIERGTSTLASSLAVGDVMAISLAISLAWLLRGARQRLVLCGACVVFAFGAIASGQFSGIIGTVVAVMAVGLITRSFGRLALTTVPVAAIGVFALWPVIARRLAGFSSPEGLPISWQGRLENLRTFFWPELFNGVNWVLGVRPAGRVPAPVNDIEGLTREFVFIESGHTYLLWTGGLPLLVAFYVFLVIAFTRVLAVARSRVDSIGVAATATAAAVCVVFVLVFLDMHLTLRGMGDLFFTLLALSLTAWRPVEPDPEVET